jgi:uncharacterized paraquat-inducible protein A
MTDYRHTVFRQNFKLTHECASCKEVKTAAAFGGQKVGVCNVCRSRLRANRQEFVNKRNEILFQKEIRDAGREFELIKDRDL